MSPIRLLQWTIGAVILISFAADNCRSAELGQPGDGTADVLYDPLTGNISIDPDGFEVGGFQLISSSGIFTGDDAMLPPGLIPTDTDTEISLAAFDVVTLDPFSLGNVAQPDLSEAFLLQDITTLRGSSGLGTPTATFTLIVGVPEPASGLLLSLAMAGLGLVRWRR